MRLKEVPWVKDGNKTKQQLIAELVEIRQRAEVLEAER